MRIEISSTPLPFVYLQFRLPKVRAEELFEIPLGELRPRRVVAAAASAAASHSSNAASGTARGQTRRAASEGLRKRPNQRGREERTMCKYSYRL